MQTQVVCDQCDGTGEGVAEKCGDCKGAVRVCFPLFFVPSLPPSLLPSFLELNLSLILQSGRSRLTLLTFSPLPSLPPSPPSGHPANEQTN